VSAGTETDSRLLIIDDLRRRPKIERRAAGHSVAVKAWLAGFDSGFAAIAGRFGRVQLCRPVVLRSGPLSDVDRCSCWRLAERCRLEPAVRRGLRSSTTLIRAWSSIALPRLVTEGFVADAAFVDGSHRFHEIFLDLYYLREIVRPGGLIVLDDDWAPLVRTGVRYYEQHLGWTVTSDAFASPAGGASIGRTVPVPADSGSANTAEGNSGELSNSRGTICESNQFRTATVCDVPKSMPSATRLLTVPS
jgi:Methyltransferase domain